MKIHFAEKIPTQGGSIRVIAKKKSNSVQWKKIYRDEKLKNVHKTLTYKKTGKLIISISPRYYRELETNGLAGDPTETMQKTGWSPNYSFEMLLEEMIKYEIEKN